MLVNIVSFYLAVSIIFIDVSTKSITNTWIKLRANDISEVSSRMDLNDPSRSGNYTVSFVPLISVIANYLPKFLKRLRTPENIVSARSLNWLLTDKAICTPYHLGRFPNPDNHCQFFECAMNFKNLLNCSSVNLTNENTLDSDFNKHIDDVIQLKSKIESNKNENNTSIAIMYKVDQCVSLILHQCSPLHIYSNRLQRCISYNDVQCPDH